MSGVIKFSTVVFLIAAISLAFGQKRYSGTEEQQFTILEEYVNAINSGEPAASSGISIIDESFEGTFPPAGWTKLNPDGGSGWDKLAIGTTPIPGWTGGVVTGPANGGSSVAFATWNTGGTTSNDQWIISPQVTGVEDSDSLIFWMRYWPDTYDDNVDVRISTTVGNDPAAFSTIVDQLVFSATSDTNWVRYAYKITDHVAAGSDIYIGIREHVTDNFNDGASISLDLFSYTREAGARLQVIHNAADPAAAEVDVYLDGTLLLDNFPFRGATPFIDAPTDVPFNVGIAPGTSTSVNDTLKNFVFNLPAGTYVAVANGVLDPNNFAANPDGRDIAFTIFAKGDAREAGTDPNNVDFFVLHGATDAPTVDVIARDVITLVDDAAYGDITDYISVPAASYILDVTPGNANDVIVASFAADLSGLGGGAAAVFASGFLNPAANQNGAAFGIFAALPDGNVVELPALTGARLQVIHNAADPAAAEVDVYLDGTLLLDNFPFRGATPFIDAPGNTNFNVGIAPGSSGSVNDTLANFVFNLPAGGTYVGIANGVLDPSGFAANPDGRDIAFTIFAAGGVREAGTDPNNVDFIVLHGATDAPTVDVIARDVATLVDNAAYGDISSYISVPAASYVLDVTPGDDNTNVVAAFGADLSGLGGGAAVVFASGFLDPSMNQNGEGFGIFAALPDGNVVAFPAVSVGIEDDLSVGVVSDYELSQNYPNPFNPSTTIRYAIPAAELTTLKVYNLLGQVVATLVNEVQNAGRYQIEFDASNLASGVYLYQIQSGSFVQTRKMVLMK